MLSFVVNGVVILFAAVGVSAIGALLWHFRGLSLREICRVLQIEGDYTKVYRHMRGVINAVTFFGSARLKPDDPRYQLGRRIARKLAARALEVCKTAITFITGDGPGGMLATHHGGHEGGAKLVGLGLEIPFEPTGYPNPYCKSEERLQIGEFAPRKRGLVKWADLAIIILEYGVGTLDELFEKITVGQCQKDPRNIPIYIVDDGGAEPLHHLIMGMLERRTISGYDVARITLVNCPSVPLVMIPYVHRRDEIGRPLPKEQWWTEQVTMRRLASEDEMIEEIVGRMAANLGLKSDQK